MHCLNAVTSRIEMRPREKERRRVQDILLVHSVARGVAAPCIVQVKCCKHLSEEQLETLQTAAPLAILGLDVDGSD